jgi:hypothetical protein
VEGEANARQIVLTGSEGSNRLDMQIKRGGVIDLDYKTDLGLNLLLRGGVLQGLCVAITDSKTNSSVFIGVLQPGWEAAYISKAGATAKFALTTQSAAAVELAKLGIPELTLLKVAKKGNMHYIVEVPMFCCCFC